MKNHFKVNVASNFKYCFVITLFTGKLSPRPPVKSKSGPTSPQPPIEKEIKLIDKLETTKQENEKNEKLSETNILSPSEDQKTYVDIMKRVGVETVDKGISTDVVEPYKPLVKKAIVVKINQECQTDEEKTEQKAITKTIKPIRPAYSTALSKNTIKTTITKSVSKPDVNKIPPRTIVQRTVRSVTTRPLTERTILSRSKTVDDIKPSTNKNTKLTLTSRNTLIRKTPEKPATTNRTLIKNFSKETNELCSSSAETIINTFDQNQSFDLDNHVTSSAENLNSKNVKDLDGWLTVKCRSRFRNNCKRSSDPTNHWANRFNQVSATASLPALALLPENKLENGPINKNTKDSLNTLKSQAKKTENRFIKRSNTTLSRTNIKTDFKTLRTTAEKNKTNMNIKKSGEIKKKHEFIDSETESDSKTKDDIASEEEHRKETQRLTEEEALLTKQIAELQSSDIDVDTETDGTETDGELQGEADCEGESEEPEDGLSLEARYEPVLAGKFFKILTVKGGVPEHFFKLLFLM